MHRNSVLLLIVATILTSVSASAQREGENWHFGRNVSLSFASGEPVALAGSQMNTFEGCASMSDFEGNLLFYSDGSTVWTSIHTVMVNGTGLMGDASSTQSCIAVPWPNEPGKYYLFTVDNAESNYIRGLRYSVINMNAMSGYGAVEEKNVLLEAPAAEKATAVRHRNGRDVWLIAHRMNSPTFLVYLITENGIAMVPITQNIGPTLVPLDVGYLKSNLQGDRLAMACSVPSGLHVFAFDNSTGAISDPLALTSFTTYGVEFSPSGRYLYATSWLDWPIYQYDLSLPPSDIGPQAVVIASARRRGALQLAPNGRIYSVRESIDHLDAIYDPDKAGSACRFVEKAYELPSVALYGLPNFFPALLSMDIVFQLGVNDACAGDTVTVTLLPPDKARAIRWDMGEPGFSPDPRDTLDSIRYVYRTSGTHSVTVRFVVASSTAPETVSPLIV